MSRSDLKVYEHPLKRHVFYIEAPTSPGVGAGYEDEHGPDWFEVDLEPAQPTAVMIFAPFAKGRLLDPFKGGQLREAVIEAFEWWCVGNSIVV